MDPNPFLNHSETRQLQAMYEEWIKNLKPNELAIKLHSANILSTFEYERFQTIQMTSEKSSFLFHNVLMKATYEDMRTIRKALLGTRVSTHKVLAKMMPIRQGDFVDFDEFDFAPQNEVRTAPSVCSEDYDMLDDDYNNLPLNEEGDEPSSMFTYSEAQQASRPAAKRQAAAAAAAARDKTLKAAAKADYSAYKPALSCYPAKKKNNPRRGSGLCVIMRNFSVDLPGYKADAQAIREFFENELQYEVWADNYGLVDMCEDDFRAKLKDIQQYLKSMFTGSSVDRFFMFILSHGDEQGIKMNKPGSKHEEEVKNEQPVRITVDEITKMFHHDEVKFLKGFPKCFFIQACQGTNVAKTAARADHQAQICPPGEPYWEPPQSKITVGADIMVCLPSERGTYSWVPSTGSWYIQETINIMKKYYRREHLVDIMVEVNKALSIREGRGREHEQSEIIQVSQMPGICCSLTKKFFLSIPPIDPYNKVDEET